MSQKVRIIFKRDTFSVIFEERGIESKFFVFDYEYRLNIAFMGGKTYRVGFDGSVMCVCVDNIKF